MMVIDCCRRTSRNGILRWDFFNLTFLLQIYALNKVMTELEHFNFRQFCKAKGIDPKIWQKPHYLKIYIERYIYTKGTRKRKRCHFQMDSQDLQCTFNIDWWQWLTFFSCSLFFLTSVNAPYRIRRMFTCWTVIHYVCYVIWCACADEVCSRDCE